MSRRYKRVLLKISGESLAGDQRIGINYDVLGEICNSVKKCVNAGVEICIVVGGGNFFRGRDGGKMDRTRADHMGMLATMINSLAMGDTLEQLGLEVRVMSAISMQQVAEPYIRGRALRHLEKGRVVIFGCGTGSPYFSTDTTAALRAAEMDADIILKASLVDGVYDKDPNKFTDAKRYSALRFDEVLQMGLQIMDSTAAAMCKDNNIPILVFSILDPHNICKAVLGEDIGTIVTN